MEGVCYTELEIIANILKHLNASELRSARLVSRGFNVAICSHPELLWAKNKLHINMESVDYDDGESQFVWAETRLSDLIFKHACPNFHFCRTNLESTGALAFFQSSVRQQIKYFKLTECAITAEGLFSILASVAKTLEHLEIIDFSNIQLKIQEVSGSGPPFRSLHTVILQSQPEEVGRGRRLWTPINLSDTFLHCLFYRTKTVRKILLIGWGSETFFNLIQVLRSMPPTSIEKIYCVELGCVIDNSLHAAEQFSFINAIYSLELPGLKKLVIRFNRKLRSIPGLSKKLIEELTKSMSSFLHSSAASLEVLELVNCPVSNAMFSPQLHSFACLSCVNTRGSFVTELDREGNVINDANAADSQMHCRRKPKTIKHVRITTETTPSTQPLQPTSVSRREVYQIGCFLLMCFIFLHCGLKYVFESFPHIARQLEALILVSVVCFVVKGNDIKSLWTGGSSPK